MKKSVWSKIGWFFVAMAPALLSLAMQVGVGVVHMLYYLFLAILNGGEAATQSQEAYNLLVQQATEKYMNEVIFSVAIYHVLGILVFGIWYYIAYGRKKRPEGIEKPGVKGVVLVAVLGVLLQTFVTGVLGMLMEAFPKAFESYFQMMELAGITEVTFLAVTATVVLAPIGEELLCRGIIQRLAEKVSTKFWIINCVQAFAFGLIHGNLVQGTYAFFLGLVLGYIYKRYQNIWMCMLLHAVINLMSNFMDTFFETVCGKKMLPVAIISIVSGALIALVLKAIAKSKQIDKP